MKTPREFRDALKKLMPGFAWTVHKQKLLSPGAPLVATGTQASGFNRTATVQVSLRDGWFTVKSAGYGAKADWGGEAGGSTLAQAFRSLQTHYERSAQSYTALAATLQDARKA